MSWRRTSVVAVLVATLSVGFAPAVVSAQGTTPSTARAAEPTPAMATTTTPTAASTLRIDLNSASVTELTRLPGIGPAKAQAIATYRTRRRFRRPEDIIRVPGVGRKTFRRLRPFLEASAKPLPSPAK